MIVEIGGVGVGRRRAGHQAGSEGGRLRAHEREQVDRELLHVRVGRRAGRVGAAKPAGELDRAGAEDVGPAGRLVQAQVVGDRCRRPRWSRSR